MSRLFVRKKLGLCLSLLALAAATSEVSAQQALNVTASASDLSPQWVPVPDVDPQNPTIASTALGATVNNPPTAPYPCTMLNPTWNWSIGTVQYSADGSNYSPGDAGAYTAWIVQPDPHSSAATLYVRYFSGGYWYFPCVVNVVYYDSCDDSWRGTATVSAKGTSVELISLTVVTGATQTNVTGADNWAAVKTKAGDIVIAQAKTKPNNPDGWAQIQWTNGAKCVTDNQRSVDKGTSAKTTVTAQIGRNQFSVNIWVLWATIQILTANPKPANAPNFGTADDGTENLGAVTWQNGNLGAGKICAVGKITPAGVHNVVTSGWNFRRDKWRHDFKDGAKDNDRYDSTWQGDDPPQGSSDPFKKCTPDNDEKIYDLDGPSIGPAGTDSYERYDNFREYIQWNGDMCSDYTGWYYKARWKKNNTGTNQVTLNDVSAGALDLSDYTMAFYPPP